ncbi:MAG TPA: hypothetical protein VIV55_10220 [Flavobacterium sp.]
METTENNKLIAEFMGAKDLHNTNEYELYGFIEDIDDGEDEQHHFTPEQMLFDSDWNWLMEVVGKIEGLNYWVNRIDGDVWIVDNNKEIIINNQYHSGGIEAVYKSVLEFVKWYNEQEKTEIMATKNKNVVEKLVDHDNDRVIFFSVENNTVTAIDFRQGITDPTEMIFEPDEDILLYFNKIYSRTKIFLSIGETLKKAVEVYCTLNIYE